MKLLTVSLFVAAADAITVHRQAPETFDTQVLLDEMKRRISDCATADGVGNPSTSVLSTDGLLAELKKREDAKVCTTAAPGAESTAAAATTAAATTTMTTTTTSGKDTFGDELLDQGNADFDMMDKNKNGCIEVNEMDEQLEKQVAIAEHRNYQWQQKKVAAGAAEQKAEYEQEHAHADANGDGCLSKEEFENVRHQVHTSSCHTKFVMMDHNGDSVISRQEAATHTYDHTPQADISYDKFRDIFEASDTNHDNYLTEEEFCASGKVYKGDGSNA